MHSIDQLNSQLFYQKQKPDFKGEFSYHRDPLDMENVRFRELKPDKERAHIDATLNEPQDSPDAVVRNSQFLDDVNHARRCRQTKPRHEFSILISGAAHP